jgi:hypothetical protein
MNSGSGPFFRRQTVFVYQGSRWETFDAAQYRPVRMRLHCGSIKGKLLGRCFERILRQCLKRDNSNVHEVIGAYSAA